MKKQTYDASRIVNICQSAYGNDIDIHPIWEVTQNRTIFFTAI